MCTSGAGIGTERLWRAWIVAGLGLTLWATPPPPLSAAATARLLRRLTMCSRPGALAGVRLEADESWTVAGAERPSEVETDAVVFYRGVPLELEQTRNRRALSAGAERRQARAAAAVERRIDAAAGAGGKRLLNLRGEIWPMARLEAQFVWRGVRAERGEVKLEFTPRAGIKPRSRVQRLLSRTAGAFLVDAASGQVLRGRFHNLAPVDFGAGILARFTRFAGRFALQPAQAAWVLREVVVEVRGRELWRRIRGTETMRYRVLGPPDAAAAPGRVR